MTGLALLEHFCAEADEIVADAEEKHRRLTLSGACEGHLLMAEQALTALKHLRRIVDHHRIHAASAAIPDAVTRSNLGKRPWWTGAWRIARADLRRLDAHG